jgi:hypothetical protein
VAGVRRLPAAAGQGPGGVSPGRSSPSGGGDRFAEVGADRVGGDVHGDPGAPREVLRYLAAQQLIVRQFLLHDLGHQLYPPGTLFLLLPR